MQTLTPTLLLAAALLTFSVACADDDLAEPTTADLGPSSHSGGEHLSRLTEALELTEEQVDLAAPILESARAERQALRGLPREERREAHQALRAELRVDLEGVLTPEQLERFDALPRGRRGHARGEHHRSPEARLEHLTERLGLDDTQVAQAREHFEAQRSRVEELRQSEGDRESKREQHRALREESRAAIEAILTPEQQALFQEMRPERHHRRGGRGLRGQLQGLDLTDDQRTQVREVMETLRDQRPEMGQLSREDRRAAREAFRAEVHQALEPILTEEQRSALETRRSERRGRRGHHQSRSR